MISLTVNSLPKAHELAVHTVVNHGDVSVTQDNECVIQIAEPICMHINYPTPTVNPNVMLGERFMDAYTLKVTDITPLYGDKRDASYTYGNRIRAYPRGEPSAISRVVTLFRQKFSPVYPIGVDQVEYIVKSLEVHPETRRAIAITWNPPIDTNTHEPPCLQYIQCTVSDGKLNMLVLFRSHDILSGYGANLYALAKLHGAIAAQIGVNVGWLEVISNNPHIYYIRDQLELGRFGIDINTITHNV